MWSASHRDWCLPIPRQYEMNGACRDGRHPILPSAEPKDDNLQHTEKWHCEYKEKKKKTQPKAILVFT